VSEPNVRTKVHIHKILTIFCVRVSAFSLLSIILSPPFELVSKSFSARPLDIPPSCLSVHSNLFQTPPSPASLKYEVIRTASFPLSATMFFASSLRPNFLSYFHSFNPASLRLIVPSLGEYHPCTSFLKLTF
jgi:hypothetical protein